MMGISFPRVLVVVYLIVRANGVLKTADLYKQLKNHCQGTSEQCADERQKSDDSQIRLRLPQIHGGEVGYTQELELIKGVKHTVKTLSLNPPLFEIPNFFSDEESEMVIDLALEKGLRDRPLVLDSHERGDSVEETFEGLDANGDGFIDKDEAFDLPGTSDIYLTEEDVLEMFKALDLDQDKDGKISLTELKETTLERVKAYIDNQQMAKPRMRSHSQNQQVWLWHDEDELLQFEGLLEDYHDRVAQLTKLPKPIIEQSEPVQVVRYKEHGHYNCHHDTDVITPDKTCCLYGSKDCRLCRYLTVMVFLNDVEDGGECAFPIADNATFSWEVWSNESKRKCNLAEHCDKSNLVVKPQRGKALMWYNHLKDTKDMWLANRNPFSYQGSCAVNKGEKWVANIWVNINGDGAKELRAWKSGSNWLGENNQNKEIVNALKTETTVEPEAENSYTIDKNVIVEPKKENRYTIDKNVNANMEGQAAKVEFMESIPSKPKDLAIEHDSVRENNAPSSENDEKEINENVKEEISVETLQESNEVSPKGPKLSRTETSSPLPLTQEQMTPQGLPANHVPYERVEGSRIIRSIMLLLEELDQVELEIIARNLHTKLKLVCVPLIINPMGSI